MCLNPAVKDGRKTENDTGGTNEYADGPATVAGVRGYWTADGGCDKATICHQYAQNLAKAGVQIVEYDKWRMAKLADGTLKPLISGYCVATIVIRTKAGEVVLPETHIDVLQGPESGNLLYLGQKEELRLGLRSFKKQIEDLAAEIKKARKSSLQPLKRHL